MSVNNRRLESVFFLQALAVVNHSAKQDKSDLTLHALLIHVKKNTNMGMICWLSVFSFFLKRQKLSRKWTQLFCCFTPVSFEPMRIHLSVCFVGFEQMKKDLVILKVVFPFHVDICMIEITDAHSGLTHS